MSYLRTKMQVKGHYPYGLLTRVELETAYDSGKRADREMATVIPSAKVTIATSDPLLLEQLRLGNVLTLVME